MNRFYINPLCGGLYQVIDRGTNMIIGEYLSYDQAIARRDMENARYNPETHTTKL